MISYHQNITRAHEASRRALVDKFVKIYGEARRKDITQVVGQQYDASLERYLANGSVPNFLPIVILRDLEPVLDSAFRSRWK